MAAPPYQKLFWGSYHKHTAHLLHAREHGAYLLLIGALWNNDGRLPADDNTLASYAKLTPKEWQAIKPKLMPLFRVVRGKLTQPRVSEDLAKYRDTSCKRKEAGKAGGIASARKNSGNGAANAPRLPTKPEPEPEPNIDAAEERGRESAAPADDWPPEGRPADVLVQLIDSPHLDPNRSPTLVTTAGRVSAWRREGASWVQDVIPVVSGLVQRARSPIGSWKFFDAAVAQSIADNRQALTIPEARHDRPDHSPAPSARLGERQANLERALAGARRAATS
jgi:uncharacterized protein YdaU (DUF1376 family)